MKRLLAFALLLAACSTPPAPVVVPGLPTVRPLSPQEAGQIVLDATNTAAAVATESAQATATRVVALERIADAATASAIELQQQAAYAQATSQQALREIDETQAAGRATSEAGNTTATAVAQRTQQAIAGEREQVAIRDSQENGDTLRTIVLWVALAFVTLLILVMVFFFLYFKNANEQRRREHELELEQRREIHELELIRLKLAALAQAMRESRAGTVVPQLNGPPLVLPPAHPTNGSDLIDAILSDLPPVENINVIDGDSVHVVAGWGEAEIEAQRKMIELVDAAIAWHVVNKTSDPKKLRQVPDWRGLKWPSNKWQEARNLFGDALASQSGVGTYPADERQSLPDLLGAIKYGRVNPVLPPPGGGQDGVV